MIEYSKGYIQWLKGNPGAIFLIDGTGAFVSAVLLMIIFSVFNDYFGMPVIILSMLAVIAMILAVYSFTCFVFFKNRPEKFLQPIIIANVCYCILTVGLVIYFYDSLTVLDIVYFILETLLIAGLVYVEQKVFLITTCNK